MAARSAGAAVRPTGVIGKRPAGLEEAEPGDGKRRGGAAAPPCWPEVIDPRCSALVLAGSFGSLRWGGLAALRRKDIGLAACAIRVERQLTEMPGGGDAYGAPKSCASVRTVSIPSLIMPRICWHLSHYAGQDAGALVFTSPAGRPVRHGHYRRRVWLPALRGFRASASRGACA